MAGRPIQQKTILQICKVLKRKERLFEQGVAPKSHPDLRIGRSSHTPSSYLSTGSVWRGTVVDTVYRPVKAYFLYWTSHQRRGMDKKGASTFREGHHDKLLHVCCSRRVVLGRKRRRVWNDFPGSKIPSALSPIKAISEPAPTAGERLLLGFGACQPFGTLSTPRNLPPADKDETRRHLIEPLSALPPSNPSAISSTSRLIPPSVTTLIELSLNRIISTPWLLAMLLALAKLPAYFRCLGALQFGAPAPALKPGSLPFQPY